MPAEQKRPILVVLHQEHSTPGRVGLRLAERGFPLDIRRPRFGDRLPETLRGHAGAVVFGGPMSVNDPDDYLRQETTWLDVPLKEEAPLLGLCLGAQMLARHLGAWVGPHADGHIEVGWFGLQATAAGRALLPWPDRVHQFHQEGFDLPTGGTLLAVGAAETFPNQAFRYGTAAFAIQFHIELTTAMVHRWTRRITGERAQKPGAQLPPLHFEGRALHDWKTVAFLDAFLDVWLRCDRRDGAASA